MEKSLNKKYKTNVPIEGMDYYDALEIINNVDTDERIHIDTLIEAAKVAARAAEKYRALVELTQKRLYLYRDVAAKPEIFKRPWEDDDEKRRSEVPSSGKNPN